MLHLLEEINAVEGEYRQFAEKVFVLKKLNKNEEYQALVAGEGAGILTRFDEAVAKLSDKQHQLLITGTGENAEKVNTTSSDNRAECS